MIMPERRRLSAKWCVLLFCCKLVIKLDTQIHNGVWDLDICFKLTSRFLKLLLVFVSLWLLLFWTVFLLVSQIAAAFLCSLVSDDLTLLLNQFYRRPEIKRLAAENGLDGKVCDSNYPKVAFCVINNLFLNLIYLLKIWLHCVTHDWH